MELNDIVEDFQGVPGIILDRHDNNFGVLFMDVDDDAGLFWYDLELNKEKRIKLLDKESEGYKAFEAWYVSYNKLYKKYQKSKETGTPNADLRPTNTQLQKLLKKHKFW